MYALKVELLIFIKVYPIGYAYGCCVLYVLLKVFYEIMWRTYWYSSSSLHRHWVCVWFYRDKRKILTDMGKIDWYQTTIKYNHVYTWCINLGMYCIITRAYYLAEKCSCLFNHMLGKATLIARFMGPTWGPSGAGRTQVGPMLVPWTLLSGQSYYKGISITSSTNWHLSVNPTCVTKLMCSC